MWRYDAFPASEPLHKHIWEPARIDHGQRIDLVVQATKYLDEFCTLIVDDFKLQMSIPQPNRWLGGRLRALSDGMEKLRKTKSGGNA
jgi:hypothetical protein